MAFRYRHATHSLLNRATRRACTASEWLGLFTCLICGCIAAWSGHDSLAFVCLLFTWPVAWTAPRVLIWLRLVAMDKHYRGALDQKLDTCQFESARKRGPAAMERFFRERWQRRRAEENTVSTLTD